MTTDPIVDELHRQRAEEMERFGYDFEAYCRHLKEQEKDSKAPVVPPPDPPPNPAVQRTRVARR